MMEKKILGIDEAGRGPVVGPMILCGALITQSKIQILNNLNPIDSKKLTPKQREYFRLKLKKILTDYKIIEISIQEIDMHVEKKKLNLLEANKMVEIINYFNPDIVYIDTPQVNTKKFTDMIKPKLKCNPEIIAENYAEKYPIVASAAILAKTHRDKIIVSYQEKFGIIGSGYPSDPITISFLKKYIKEKGELPIIARKSWKTSKRLLTSFKSKQ